MYKELVFMCCAISLISISTTEAKGGRSGGGRSSGRSSSRGSSGSGGFFSSGSSGKSSSGIGGFFSSSSGSKSSSGRGGLFSSSGKSGSSFSGGWFHGFFHNTPYRYTYRPTHIGRSSISSSSNTGSYHTAAQEEEAELEKENNDYVIGYSISKALSSDFFSIFNVVHDVSKYPEKIRNKELLTTTTHSPVAPYDSKYNENPSYTKTDTIYDPKSYLPDTLFDMVDSKRDLENNDVIEESFGNFEKVFEVTSTESTPKKVETTSYSRDDGRSLFDWKNSKNGFGYSESIRKKLAEFQASLARNGFQVASTERTTTQIDTTSYSPDDNTLFDRTNSKKMFEMQSSIVRNGWKELDSTNESMDEMLKRIQDRYRSLLFF